jgi:signal transduction histidine kinase/DNA-binding response OmpR family regulator
MLEGFNKEWLYTNGSQRRVTYTNLDPGNYTFRVKVLGNNGNWSKETSLEIQVSPPFWLTPLAFILYAFTAIGLLWLGRKIIIDRARMRFNIQQQKKEAERIQALDQLKTKFFTNVSHEFRTPLSLILSPLDTIIKQEKDPDQKKQLHLVQRNAKRLLNLVNQLLDFRKMEVQEIKLYPAIGDIVQFTKDISLSFNDISEKKSIHLSFESNVDSLEIYFDKDKMEKILFNLLSNAFKYTPDGGTVKVSLRHNEQLYIIVADSGIGIPADKHEQIFERFFQHEVPQSMVNQGSGIGLAITREFVKLHGGTISVDSEPGKGTRFTVELPIRRINLVQETVPAATFAEPGGKKKTILVVEDNEDLRFYLKDNLKSTYHVEEAINGKEGWEKIRQLQPDLVVSDVMMPLMDGLELARHIKGDTLTAHIPVILLTAVGNNDKQVEGFAIGVSDYITKPFTFEILASRINNLFAQQKLLQKKFQKQIEVNPSEVTVTPVDEQFLTNALAIVEKNMDNPDFSVEEFSRDMCMSRVALYKKILSLTGRPPLEFIRSIRLKRAAQLLGKSGKSVSEIAYEVGFNNPKVFTKYFKEEFKILPSQYKVNN